MQTLTVFIAAWMSAFLIMVVTPQKQYAQTPASSSASTTATTIAATVSTATMVTAMMVAALRTTSTATTPTASTVRQQSWSPNTPPVMPAQPTTMITVTVRKLRDMNVGVVIAELGKKLRCTDLNAARFVITAPPRTELNCTVVLPSMLTHTRSSGSVHVPYTFSMGDAAWSETDMPTRLTMIHPAQPFNVTVPASGQVYVWIGGTVAATRTRTNGQFTGRVECSVIARFVASRP